MAAIRTIEAGRLCDSVARLYAQANHTLPADVQTRMAACRAAEEWPAAAAALQLMADNARIAAEKRLPICQDTGMACVFLQIGDEVHVQGSIPAAVNEGVRRATRDGLLRHSVVDDPLRRRNTGDNTPAMLNCEFVPGDRLCVTVAPKGFGSENMSAVRMLKPADGRRGVADFVVETVLAAGPNPCPPVVVGVGLGGTFDQAALLAKKALLRPLGQPHADSCYAQLEAELLRRINALGIGPQGFGGATTALWVAVQALPTHIAGLPCAVNINCHVARHATEVL